MYTIIITCETVNPLGWTLFVIDYAVQKNAVKLCNYL